MIDNAKSGKSGWVEYQSKNTTSGKVEPKVTYYEPVGDVVIAAGIYK
jgi:hypothetical protein